MKRPAPFFFGTLALSVSLLAGAPSFIAAAAAEFVAVTENTLRLAEGSTAAQADLADLAWIAGHWSGEGFGGQVEETWTPPSAGSMVGTFKLSSEQDGILQPSFYEFMAIFETDEGLVLRLKHFHPDVKGWEEKDEFVDFPLVKIDGRRVYFRGLTYERTTDDELRIYLAMRTSAGMREVEFKLARAK